MQLLLECGSATSMDEHETSDTRPILIALRALKLGDLLVAVPALHGLRRSFDHRIVYAGPAWLAPIIELVDAIDEHLITPGLDAPVPFPAGKADIAINLHGSGDESSLRVRELQARVTIDHDERVCPWQDGIQERDRWVRLVNAHGANARAEEVGIRAPSIPPAVAGAAVVHVGAFHGARAWPVERFAVIARRLWDEGIPVVITGGKADRKRAIQVAQLADLPESVVQAGTASLEEFAALVASARFVLSVDTGAAHLASAYGIPSVIIFGPAPPQEWGPPPGPHIVLTHPHLRRGETFADDPDPALLAVSVEEVWEATASLLSSGALQRVP